MADNPDSDSSPFNRTVVLRDWWLIKCAKEFEGKRFGVAGTQIAETRAVRVFTSSPIVTAFDVFTLQASDGVCIILRGFLNKQRLVQSGFLPEISREFIFGFPPCWESKCNSCFVGVPSGSVINKASSSRSILSPCKWNLEDSPALVVEKNIDEGISDKDGLGGGGGSTARDDKPARKRSLRLQSKSVEASKVKNNHGSDGLSKGAKSCGVEKDEGSESKVNKCTNGGDDVDKVTSKSAVGGSLTSEQGKGEVEAKKACPRSLLEDLEKSNSKPGKKAVSTKSGRILRSAGIVVEHMDLCGDKVKTVKSKRKLDVSEVQDPTTNDAVEDVNHSRTKVKRKLGVSEVQNPSTNDVVHDSEGLNTGAGNVDKVTSVSAVVESLTSEQGKGELGATKACPRSLFEDLEKSSGQHGKKAVSTKSGRTLRSAGIVVEDVNHSGTKVKRKLGVSEVQDPSTNDVGHDSEGLNKAKGNVVGKDECMDNEEIPRVDVCGKMHSGTKSKKITSKNATLTSEQQKGKVTKTCPHSLSKEVSDSSKGGKNGKSKRSEKIVKSDSDVVEPMTPSGSRVKDNLSVGKTIRKIDFDEEVTPEKDAKKPKIAPVSADSLGQRRSRSGRVLVSSLEFWRNQVPVYDEGRNLIQVNKGNAPNSTPPKGKGSVSRKPAKKMKIK